MYYGGAKKLKIGTDCCRQQLLHISFFHTAKAVPIRFVDLLQYIEHAVFVLYIQGNKRH